MAPPARELLAWIRLLFAARYLEDPKRSVQSIAHALGYSTESGLRRVMLNLFEVSTLALRRTPGGALAAATSLFTQRCAQLRAGTSGAGEPRWTDRPRV